MAPSIAVLTGDVIDSRQITDSRRLHRVLDAELGRLARHHGGRYQRYRGDGFQLALSAPDAALEAAVTLRAALIMHSEPEQRWDARVAIAVGQDDWQPAIPLAEADGAPFVQSGQTLDALGDGPMHLALAPLDVPRDGCLSLLLRYVDELVEGWSRYSAEIAYLSLWHAESQQALAARLGISQPSVHKRLRAARWTLLADSLTYLRERLGKEAIAS